MFTGAKLIDSHGSQLIQGREIRNILQNYGQYPASVSQPYFFPNVTVLYQENYEGQFFHGEKLIVSTDKKHAEQQFIAMSSEHLRSVRSIIISYSPCTARCADAIVERYKEESLPKPVIHFSWVHNHPYGKPHGQDGIKLLIENGFSLQKWETVKMYEYLQEQAPNERLKRELQQAYENTMAALSERDEVTRNLIEEAQRQVDDIALTRQKVPPPRRAHRIRR